MSVEIRTHKDLKIWQRSVALVTRVYAITEKFPKSEMWGLTNQIRRASVSVPSNIAEGSGRRSDKELVQFLHIASGSLAELETQFIIAKNLGFITNNEYSEVEQEIQEIIRMISAMSKSIMNKQPSYGFGTSRSS
jgi:four helix bundle protein